jgi:serine/threonine-protein kinase
VCQDDGIVTQCASCKQESSGDGKYCPFCGAVLTPVSSAPTESGIGSDPASTWSSSNPDSSRYIPGTIIDGRYRVVGLLGRGGMGEVYRADDLKLGRPVALKFLPGDVVQDQVRLDRFLNEVRTALTVTHPNVCRVHDIGEVDGQHYLSMEYVDGEDLGSLLRRIGRLPEAKAVQVARQLCSGLAAAHEQGILHRDLKPANVMIDGRGRAKLTDFGLATLAQQVGETDLGAGTPAYMSPEQLEGREVTVRSDIYSLGLVLYELFTGRRAFDAATSAQLKRLLESSTPTNPSSHVENLDPAVERTILRCLDPNPADRPVSALAVSASLPGGDPLAAAIAAGETPSPEMVANAGETGALAPRIGAVLLGFVLLGLVGIAAGLVRFSVPGRVALEKPPEALIVEAKEVLDLTGRNITPRDRSHSFIYDNDYFTYVESEELNTDWWNDIATARPAPIQFWYRESPRPLVATGFFVASDEFSVSPADPPPSVEGMAGVWLDPQGRLLRFLIVPPPFDSDETAPNDVDWSPFFTAAGLEVAQFESTVPRRNPPVRCDSRAAWRGTAADPTTSSLVVEACSADGRPIHFEVIPPWRVHAWQRPDSSSSVLEDLFFTSLLLAIAIGGPLVARRNLRLGRGDRRGAVRLASISFTLAVLSGALLSHHVVALAEIGLILELVGYALVISSLVWIVYIALEPYARRLWPDGLIAWSRLLSGRFRDPLVGRDILIGAGFGVFMRCWWLLYSFVLERFELPVEPLVEVYIRGLSGLPATVGAWLDVFAWSIYAAVGWLFIVLLLQLFFRRRWMVVTVIMLLWVGSWVPGHLNPVLFGSFVVVAFATFIVVLLRFGLLATMAWGFFSWLPTSVVLTLDPSAWYFGRSAFTLLILAGIAAYAFRISLAGRPLIGHDPLERS